MLEWKARITTLLISLTALWEIIGDIAYNWNW
jgi:hypothetical protein